MHSKDKLNNLRIQMQKQGLDGFIVPRADEYQGEFVAPYAERLLWLTGFTGSAGAAVVLKDKAAVFTDPRYTIQLRRQVDGDLYACCDSTKTPPAEWIAEEAEEGAVIGYDPRLHTPKQIEALEKAALDKGGNFKPVPENLIDMLWDDQPVRPGGPARLFPLQASGKNVTDKLNGVREALRKNKLDAAMITLPDSLAWLFNIRGDDIAYTPVVLSYGIVYADAMPAARWFVDPARVPEDVRDALSPHVEIEPPEEMAQALAVLKGQTVGLDDMRSPVWFKNELEAAGAGVHDFKDPCIDPKARKTQAEQKSIRDAHIKDGVALVKFLAWLDRYQNKADLSELDIAAKLEEFRREDETYLGKSFPTIAGFGPNGAIVHYRPDEQTNLRLAGSGLLLIDSGGQYTGGTTDITRTLAIGEPTQEMRENYTHVLKGHIAVARAVFPEGTVGMQIDAFARQPLWTAGLDYAHGTGHGVGCALAVHEEAANLSPRGKDALQPGMLLSNEPGYYKEGSYGIRLENLVFVTGQGVCESSGKNMLGFETVSFVPFDNGLIEKPLLNSEERAWLDDYHAAVLETLTPFLDQDIINYLQRQTQAL